MEKKKFFKLPKILKQDNDEIKKLKEIKKKIRKIKTMEDLDALEDELIAIGVIDKQELERIEKLRNKKRRKSQKENFEERVRCNLEIINRTILVGKQFKMQEKQRAKDEERIPNKEERTRNGGAKQRDREER